MSDAARQRAANFFKKPDDEERTAATRREIERQGTTAKTARLRAMRLARDAENAPNGRTKPKSESGTG